ncbi:hypothetical protein EATA6166_36590 [Enterobacter asburiae]|nr:hypothetical protein EATA6166_36590 [Enterobacter asburiae]SHH31563.1 CbeA_antitoxin, type IV, cytoskeleton bundling-enhancing factor A [Pantoea sesami]
MQEGDRLHFLADLAGFNGAFCDDDALYLDQAFPLILKQLELILTSGELSPAISTVSPSITTDSPAKPIRLVVVATYTSPFIPLNVSYFHERKNEISTYNKYAGGEAMPVARDYLANAT